MGDKVIGILGGMGPESTWDFFGRIIKLTPAGRDSDHIHVIIDSNPKIPDRTKAILNKGPSPVPAMIAAGKNLQMAGADFIVMPCMTAHCFIEQVQNSLSKPVVNALLLLQHYVESNMTALDKIAVIATTGSLESKIYERTIGKSVLMLPDSETQEHEIMDLIYGPNGIKAGHFSRDTLARLQQLITRFMEEGAVAVVAGCTEIGLVLKDQTTALPVIDPLDLLAEEAVRLAKKG